MGNGGKFKALILLRFLAILACSVFIANAATAQIFAEDSCDPLYMESLEARAWLEAQREIIQNQNLILKPDSVLEYTCFDKHLDVFSEASVMLLSGNPLFDGDVMEVADALDGSVYAATEGYLDANFGHTFLGGRSDEDYVPDGSVAPGGYDCEIMDMVWMEAKCMNFVDEPDYDGFFTFQEYEGNDFRPFPDPCGSNGPFQDNIDLALVPDDTPWEEDVVSLYMELIYPDDGECGEAASMIPTGLTVLTDKFDFPEYHEQACLVPGCKFIPTSTDDGCCTRENNC